MCAPGYLFLKLYGEEFKVYYFLYALFFIHTIILIPYFSVGFVSKVFGFFANLWFSTLMDFFFPNKEYLLLTLFWISNSMYDFDGKDKVYLTNFLQFDLTKGCRWWVMVAHRVQTFEILHTKKFKERVNLQQTKKYLMT